MHSRKSQSHRTNIAERFRQGDNLIMCVRAQFRPASASTGCRSTREHQRVGSRAITFACPAHRRGGGGWVPCKACCSARAGRTVCDAGGTLCCPWASRRFSSDVSARGMDYPDVTAVVQVCVRACVCAGCGIAERRPSGSPYARLTHPSAAAQQRQGSQSRCDARTAWVGDACAAGHAKRQSAVHPPAWPDGASREAGQSVAQRRPDTVSHAAWSCVPVDGSADCAAEHAPTASFAHGSGPRI